jgi:GTPase Era involved in 16S rRNA processing
MADSFELPPLPETTYGLFCTSPVNDDGEWQYKFVDTPGYTSDQTRAYARAYALAAVQAEREACAKLCDGIYTNGDMAECWTQHAAELIRARGKP